MYSFLEDLSYKFKQETKRYNRGELELKILILSLQSYYDGNYAWQHFLWICLHHVRVDRFVCHLGFFSLPSVPEEH